MKRRRSEEQALDQRTAMATAKKVHDAGSGGGAVNVQVILRCRRAAQRLTLRGFRLPPLVLLQTGGVTRWCRAECGADVSQGGGCAQALQQGGGGRPRATGDRMQRGRARSHAVPVRGQQAAGPLVPL